LRSWPWPFRVTRRHRLRDQSIHHRPFPIGCLLQPSLYLWPFSRYSAPNARGRTQTDRKTHRQTRAASGSVQCNALRGAENKIPSVYSSWD